MLIAFLVVVGAVWNSQVLEPMGKKREDIRKERVEAGKKVKMNQEIERLILARKGQDINLPLKKKLEERQKELVQLEASLKNSARRLLSPGEMTQALKRMLAQMEGVTLTSMESLPGEGVHLQGIQNRIHQATDKGGDRKQSKTPSVESVREGEDVTMYRHGLVVTLEGPYLDLMRYLTNIESLPWTFYWSGLDYSTSEEGGSRAKLFLSTMSFSDAYIGVDPDLTLAVDKVATAHGDTIPFFDPTLPDAGAVVSEVASTPEAGEKAVKVYRVTSILNSKQRQVAVINGRVLQEKESEGDMTVVAIHPLSVEILRGTEAEEIFLKSAHSGVEKKLTSEKRP